MIATTRKITTGAVEFQGNWYATQLIEPDGIIRYFRAPDAPFEDAGAAIEYANSMWEQRSGDPGGDEDSLLTAILKWYNLMNWMPALPHE